MAEISASSVKELRERTGLGMMECKKALVEADGDFDKADERGADHDLVGQRVHQLSKRRGQVVFARDVTVEKIGQPGDGENKQGHTFAERKTEGQQRHHDQRQKQAADGQ